MGLVVQYVLSADKLPIIFSVLIVVFVIAYLENRKKKKRSLLKYQLQSELREVFDGDSELQNDVVISPSLEDKEHIPYKGATVTLPGGAKEFFEIVNDRRSVRKFSSKSVSFEVIENCIRAAGTAPSGAHTEPWTFCVVQDKKIKEQIREIVETEEIVNYQRRMSKQWTCDLRPFKTNSVKEYLTTASHLILVFKQTFGIRTDGKRKEHYYNEISTAISVGILISALQAAGLSSLVTTPLNCGPALKSLLNRPANEKLMVLLPVGYAADDCVVPDLKRKTVHEIMVKY